MFVQVPGADEHRDPPAVQGLENLPGVALIAPDAANPSRPHREEEEEGKEAGAHTPIHHMSLSHECSILNKAV